MATNANTEAPALELIRGQGHVILRGLGSAVRHLRSDLVEFADAPANLLRMTRDDIAEFEALMDKVDQLHDPAAYAANKVQTAYFARQRMDGIANTYIAACERP